MPSTSKKTVVPRAATKYETSVLIAVIESLHGTSNTYIDKINWAVVAKAMNRTSGGKSPPHHKRFEDIIKDIQTPPKGISLEKSTIEQLEAKLTRIAVKKESSLKGIEEEVAAINEELEVKREMKVDQERVKAERERLDREKKEIREKAQERLKNKKRKREDGGEAEEGRVKKEKR